MNGITLEHNDQFRLLVSDAVRRGDPETAALAKALANGSEALNLTSLEQLAARIIDSGDEILLCSLLDYCVSNSIMVDMERLNRNHVKGWRKLLARVRERVFGARPFWSVFGDGEKEGDTIS